MSAVSRLPHLTLHFDVNRTLIMCDKMRSSASPTDMLVSSFAESKEGFWTPSLREEDRRISYANYVRELHPGDRGANPELAKLQFSEISKFVTWLEGHPPGVDEAEALVSEYKILEGKLRDLDGEKIFTSFYDLIDRLDDSKASYTVLLRSFGTDLSDVASEITERPGTKISAMARDVKFVDKQLLISGQPAIAKVQEIFDRFLTGEHMAIRDQYAEWKESGFHGHAGKPFVYDESCGRDSGVPNLSLFFDDGITGSKNDIVCPVEIGDTDLVMTQSRAPARSASLLDKMLFRADAVKALASDTYYIDMVNLALRVNGFHSSI